MSAVALLADVLKRGLRVELDRDGVPHLKGDRGQMTPRLLRALKAFREEVLELLRPEPEPPPAADRLREWMYGNGCVVREETWFKWGPSREGAATVLWWRYQGEAGWRPAPGTPAGSAELPEGEHLAED